MTSSSISSISFV